METYRWIINGCTGKWIAYRDRDNIYSNITENTVIQTGIVVVYAGEQREALIIGIKIHEEWLKNMISNSKV